MANSQNATSTIDSAESEKQENNSLDQQPRPAKWHNVLPHWLISLLWADSVNKYDAFLSYSWNSDIQVAPVIQSVLQQFLRPWFRPRAKTIFRDLASMPAGSSFEKELYNRLDRSDHLIVLASPKAPHSEGMEMEAKHWFSRKRQGEVLIIVTDGEVKTWEDLGRNLLPPSVRANLPDKPLWITLQHRRSKILETPNDPKLRAHLIEDLQQVFLRLYAPKNWDELQGEERAQRRRALSLVWWAALLFLLLAIAAIGFAWYAQTERRKADLSAAQARNQEKIAKQREKDALGARAEADASAKEANRERDVAAAALRAREESEQNAQTAEAKVEQARLELDDLQKKAKAARDEAKRAAEEAGKLKDESALRRFSALAATNAQLTVAGALASIEAIGRQTSSEAYESLLESLARLPRRIGTVPWKRTAEIRSSGEANGCVNKLDTMERICWHGSTVFQSRNYIVVGPSPESRRSAQPVSDLQYWDIWHQDNFQNLNIAVPPRSALSPSGRYLATPEADAVVTVREFPSGRKLFGLGSPIREPQSAPAAQAFPLYSRAAAIQFSNDERYLITSVVRPGVAFEHTEFSIWDLEARRRVSWYIGSDRLEFSLPASEGSSRNIAAKSPSETVMPFGLTTTQSSGLTRSVPVALISRARLSSSQIQISDCFSDGEISRPRQISNSPLVDRPITLNL